MYNEVSFLVVMADHPDSPPLPLLCESFDHIHPTSSPVAWSLLRASTIMAYLYGFLGNKVRR